MINASITQIEYYLPEKILTNEMLKAEFENFDLSKIEGKIGIRQRHVVREDETALDLALQAVNKLLVSYPGDQIDFLILCTQSPDYFLPTTACILQEKAGLPTHVGALDFNLGCSGFVYGLALAKGLICAGVAAHVLLVTSETYTRHIHPKDRSNRIIFGDGAAAVVVGQTEKNGIGEFVFGTDGRGFKNLIVPNGGMRQRQVLDPPEVQDAGGSIRTDNHLYMNGPDIFNFTIEAVPAVFHQTLEKNHCTLQDIDYVIFHQANKYMLDYLRKKCEIPEDKFYLNMQETGNTVSATIPIALKNCIEQKIIPPDSRILLLGFGVGYSWGGTIIQI